MGPVIDAEWALIHLQRALWDPVEPAMLGSLSDSLHYRVNGEVYRFSSTQTLERFAKRPVLWCGVLRDPVTGRRFIPSSRSPEVFWVGGPYFFESDSTKDHFVEDPKKYEIIRRM